MEKLKFILLLFCVMAFQNIMAQTNNYVIIGKVDDQFENRYAFLYSYDRKITLNMPIVNSAFKFTVEKASKFETAILYFGLDSTLKYSDISSNRMPGVVTQLTIVLEDSVNISVTKDLKNSIIIGGILNEDWKEMNATIKSGNYLSFFNSHSNSPLALIFLKALTRLKNNLTVGQNLNCELYFSKLSEELKKSPEGILVWERVIN